MPQTTTPKATAASSAAKKLPHKLYTVGGQKRALFTLGSGADCQLMDVPAALLDIAASGRETADSYVVERGLRPRVNAAELQALLTDYLAMAKRHQAVPMTVLAIGDPAEAYAA